MIVPLEHGCPFSSANTPTTHLSSHNGQPSGEKANEEEGAVEFEVGRLDMHPGHFVAHMPSCSLSSFVLCVLCLLSRGAREPSFGFGSLEVARELSRAAAYGQGGREVGRYGP